MLINNNMNKIEKYNELVEYIVKDFVIRVFEEDNMGVEVNESDYRIITYQGIMQGPVELFDRYFSLDDILMCEAYKIPTKILIDYYDEDLEAHMNNKTLGINFYNYAMRNKDNEKYYNNQFESIKESEKKVEEAKQQLEDIIGKID